MSVAQRGFDFTLGLLKRHGPSRIKKALWDREFSSGKWNFIDETAGDCVYLHLEKYARKGDILDLGCGPGNTANELAATSYRTYVGVDISDQALQKARDRTHASGRTQANRFEQGDFLSYVPNGRYDVILFREAMYHVPVRKVERMLDRYSKHLNEGGVFIVRMFACTASGVKHNRRARATVRVVEKAFEIVERSQYGALGPTVVVFRPRLLTLGQ
jgi:SAM-dependent methyltransferase